jgi:hypothetical protein
MRGITRLHNLNLAGQASHRSYGRRTHDITVVRRAHLLAQPLHRRPGHPRPRAHHQR